MRTSMSIKQVFVWLLVLLLPLVFLGCSKSSGDDAAAPAGEATSLQVAEKVSVVDAKLSGSVAAVAPLKVGSFQAVAADLAATSDYKTDVTQVWVQERSAEAFNIVNEILCMFAQTKYEAMLNKGPYIALVDMSPCSSEKSDTSNSGQESQNQSSGSTAPKYEKWTVDVTRADGASPEYIKVWIHESANPMHMEPEKIILVRVEITEGKSETNPYGIFTLNFEGKNADDGMTMFKGYLKSEKDAATGKILLKFVEESPLWDFKEASVLNRNEDGSGSGKVYQKEEWDNTVKESTFNIAYDAANFLRVDADTSSSVCLNRNEFDESAWRYGLYDSAGTRVKRNSGFSINTAADGSGSHGWVGYWGVWVDENTTLSNGDTVYQYDYNSQASTPYTIFTVAGKLKKHTKKNLTLADVQGIPLDFFDWDPTTNEGANYRVEWTDSVFSKVALMNCSETTGNCNWDDIPPVAISVDTLQWGELNFWSQSLGGEVRVPLQNCTWADSVGTESGSTSCDPPTNATQVIFFKEDIVYPDDSIPASLVCYESCPKAGATGIDTLDPNYQSWDQATGQSIARTYQFDTATMLLMDNGNAVVSSTTGSDNQWGYMSGALIDPDTPNLTTLLACDWNPSEICGWKARGALDVFYSWETGPNDWNQFTGLKDAADTFLAFDPPLHVQYVHNETGSSFDGGTFFMEYAGFGNLHGIPGICVDMNTGLEANCQDGGPDVPIRWVPAFTIPSTQPSGDLTEVIADLPTGQATYFIKALEIEQRMKEDPSGCAALTSAVSTGYELPVIADWVAPAIGTEPVITDPPAVIGGVVQ